MKNKSTDRRYCLSQQLDSSKKITSMLTSVLQERSDKYGVHSLTDSELLHLITGVPVKTADDHLNEHGLAELIKFVDCMKLTIKQKKRLIALYHLIKRISISGYREKEKLDSSSKSGEFFIRYLQHNSDEVFIVAFLDSQNRLISVKEVFRGTINECAIYPRNIVKLAILKNASAVIIGHNHPAGSLTPSKADRETTAHIVRALDIVGIKTVDHIIVAEDKYVSFAEKGLLDYPMYQLKGDVLS